MKGNSKKRHIFRNVLLWILGIWVVLLIAVRVIVTPSVLTGIVNDLADKFVDGDVSFGRVSISVLKNFPNLNVTLHDFVLTYPHGRFASEEGSEVLMRFGCGEESDTLASFKEFSTSVNLASLAVGRIDIPSVTLHNPRIFAKKYRDGLYNWDVLRMSSDSTATDKDTVATQLPSISLEKIELDGKPVLVYCNRVDTLFAFMKFKEMKFRGKVSTTGNERGRIGLTVDSLFVSGRIARDTLGLGLDKLNIKEHEDYIDLKATAKTFIATNSMGRVRIPVNISSNIIFPEDSVTVVSFHKTKINVAGIPLKADLDIRKPEDGFYVNGGISIDKCNVGEVLYKTRKINMRKTGYFKTTATVSLLADFNARYGNDGRLGVDINKFHFNGPALCLDLSGTAKDVLGDDPLFDVKAKMDASLDSIGLMLKPEDGYTMEGAVKADISGKVRMSQLDLYNFAGADLKGYVSSPELRLASVKDNMSVYMDSAEIRLGILDNKRSTAEDDRVLALNISLDSTNINYKNNILLAGKDLSFKVFNVTDVKISENLKEKVHPLGGKLRIGQVSIKDAFNTGLFLRNSETSFQMYPEDEVPVINFKSANGRIFLRHTDGRLALRDLNMDAKAKLTAQERKRRAKAFVDSLAAAHPDVPRDSLFIFWRQSRKREVSEWLKEEDFKKKDLDFKLDESLTKYIRDWDAEGNLSIGRASLMTPYFPLRTRVTGFRGKVTNNDVTIDGFNLTSGKSGLSATGRLSGLRRALQGRGGIKLDLAANADSLQLNELLGAYVKGSEYSSVPSDGRNDSLDDAAFEKAVTTDTLANVKVSESSLFVVPANLEADIALKAENVTYSTVKLDTATANIRMMHRCIQITNTTATSNIGNLGFEGFYSTVSKHDLKTGFRLQMDKITADKVIELLPAVDTVMPILKTFRGNLNCEIAATADLDTNMNVVMPSLNGVIRLGGKNLEIKDDPAIDKLMKILKFKNRDGLRVNAMAVEGQIADNTLEIFPFILNVDRYMLGMSGIQKMDQTFKYHVSIIKSPLVVRFGVDLYGNFDDFKFKIGKAKYKNANVPVFSAVVDQASINLSNSIRNIFQKGVDEAVRENRRQEAIEKYKEKVSYQNAADMPLDSLTSEDKQQLENQ